VSSHGKSKSDHKLRKVSLNPVGGKITSIMLHSLYSGGINRSIGFVFLEFQFLSYTNMLEVVDAFSILPD
jgi:hypothetical protein